MMAAERVVLTPVPVPDGAPHTHGAVGRHDGAWRSRDGLQRVQRAVREHVPVRGTRVQQWITERKLYAEGVP